METTIIYETTIVYWGYMGIIEKKMETTIIYKVILGLYWVILGLLLTILGVSGSEGLRV